jgi:hypothetical protein
MFDKSAGAPVGVASPGSDMVSSGATVGRAEMDVVLAGPAEVEKVGE